MTDQGMLGFLRALNYMPQKYLCVLSFYRNIVRKNIVCVLALNEQQSQTSVGHCRQLETYCGILRFKQILFW